MDGQVDDEYGIELFKEHKAYKIGHYNLAFVIEDMSEINGGWSVCKVKLTYYGQYWRDYVNMSGTKQEVMARINEKYESY
jgi:hypothetical protein